jgi:excisionase family DNA binding protein
MQTHPDDLMSPDDLSEYLGVPVQTVYRWRHHGTGPAGMRVSRHVRYRRSTVDAWLDSQADPRPAA